MNFIQSHFFEKLSSFLCFLLKINFMSINIKKTIQIDEFASEERN